MLGRIGSELAVLAVLCTLTIFFFPAMHGPYSAIHGPVTALQAARAAARLRIAIVQAALKILGNRLICSLVLLAWTARSHKEFRSVNPAECSAILRC